MPTECTPKLFEFEAVERRSVVAGFDGGDISSNAGGLLLGQVDRGIGLVRRFAECFNDRRDPRYVEHRLETLLGQRIFGLALGYEDLNDHDDLRKDPTFAVLAGKLTPVLRSDCEALAGKSTLNRLEHTPKRHGAKYHKIDCDGARVDALLIELFLEAHERAPREIVLDLDNTDIPLYGEQEGRFFHGYYDEYCYLPLYVFCGRHLLLARQRRANVAGSDGAVEEMARMVARIRRKWPRVHIILRADSGFSNDPLMAWCEANRVDYVFGLLLARDVVPRQEPPHRRIAEADAVTLSDFLPQLQDRQVRLRLDLREDEIGVRLDALRSAVATHLHWRDVSLGLDALRPANRGGGTDIKPRRGLTARHSAGDRLHHLLANIHRQRHNPLPPLGSAHARRLHFGYGNPRH